MCSIRGCFPDVFGIDLDLAKLSALSAATPRFAQLSFKPWCAARQTMAATQALRELVDAGIAVADITAISVSVLPPHLKMIDHGVRAGDRASHLTSLPYQMAVAALQPQAQLDVAQAPAEISVALQTLMTKIKLSADETLLADYPAAWPARVTVTTASGSHERLVRDVPGDPARPLDEAGIVEKFNRLVTPVIGAPGADRILQVATATLPSRALASQMMVQLRAL
jgi:2-methylcitrate dehydratase PrpD